MVETHLEKTKNWFTTSPGKGLWNCWEKIWFSKSDFSDRTQGRNYHHDESHRAVYGRWTTERNRACLQKGEMYWNNSQDFQELHAWVYWFGFPTIRNTRIFKLGQPWLTISFINHYSSSFSYNLSYIYINLIPLYLRHNIDVQGRLLKRNIKTISWWEIIKTRERKLNKFSIDFFINKLSSVLSRRSKIQLNLSLCWWKHFFRGNKQMNVFSSWHFSFYFL